MHLAYREKLTLPFRSTSKFYCKTSTPRPTSGLAVGLRAWVFPTGESLRAWLWDRALGSFLRENPPFGPSRESPPLAPRRILLQKGPGSLWDWLWDCARGSFLWEKFPHLSPSRKNSRQDSWTPGLVWGVCHSFGHLKSSCYIYFHVFLVGTLIRG